MPDNLLTVESIRKEFGGLLAVSDLDFTIPAESIVSLIGPNGAGKTTFFNMLTGRVQAHVGPDRVRRHRCDRQAAARDHEARDRPDVPEHQTVPADDGARKRAGGNALAAKGGILGSIFGTPRRAREEHEAHEKGAGASALLGPRPGRRRARARISPTETSAAWSSRVRSRPNRSFFSSTSRRPE